MNRKASFNKTYFKFLGLHIGAYSRTFLTKPVYFVDLGKWNLFESKKPKLKDL